MDRWNDDVRLVSWDVDGTLYSVEKMKLRLVARLSLETVTGRGRAARKQLELLKRLRKTIDQARQAGGVLDHDMIVSYQSLVATEKRWYPEAIRKTGLRPGVVEFVKFLQARGIQQVVYSDYEADYKLAALGLTELLGKIYVGVRLGYVKPNPKVLEQIAHDYGLTTGMVLHIGDRVEADERAATKAGCKSLIFGKDFNDFRSLLAELQHN